MKITEIAPLVVIKSTKEFKAAIHEFFHAPYTDGGQIKTLPEQVELQVTSEGLIYRTIENNTTRTEVMCNITSKDLYRQLESKLVSPSSLKLNEYSGYSLTIIGNEIEESFELVAKPDYNKLDRNRHDHLLTAIELYTAGYDYKYPFTQNEVELLKALVRDYKNMMITRNEIFNRVLDEIYANDK